MSRKKASARKGKRAQPRSMLNAEQEERRARLVAIGMDEIEAFYLAWLGPGDASAVIASQRRMEFLQKNIARRTLDAVAELRRRSASERGHKGGLARRLDINEAALVMRFREARMAKPGKGVGWAIDAARSAVKATRGTSEFTVGRTKAREILSRHGAIKTRVRKA